jgi:hypothetical protein
MVKLSATCKDQYDVIKPLFPNYKCVMNNYLNNNESLSKHQIIQRHGLTTYEWDPMRLFLYEDSLNTYEDIEYWSYVGLMISNNVHMKGLYNAIMEELLKYNFDKEITHKKRTLTNEQKEILKICPEPGKAVIVQAYAGCGKTTTLFEYSKKYKNKNILYLAYNKALAEDTQKKFKTFNHVHISTIHGLAYNYLHDLEMNVGKLNEFRLKTLEPFKTCTNKECSVIIQSFNQFCNSHESTMTDTNIEFIWNQMFNERAIPITHDAYLKYYQMKKVKLTDIDIILIDEVQDCTDCMLSVVTEQKHCTQIYVGDKYQKIYGFKNIDDPFKFIVDQQAKKIIGKNLSVSFRMGFDLMFFTNALLRKAFNVSKGFSESNCKNNTQIEIKPLNDLPKGTVILCRYNYTVFRTIFRMCVENKTFNVYGKKINYEKEISIVKDLINVENGHTNKLNHNKLKQHELFTMEKIIHFFNVIQVSQKWKDRIQLYQMYGGPTLIQFWTFSKTKQRKNPDIIITTAHQSKGAEFDYVALHDDFNINGEDSMNLLYVSMTRAKKILYINNLLINYFKNIKRNVYYKSNQIIKSGKCRFCDNRFTNKSVCMENDHGSIFGKTCEIYNYDHCCTPCEKKIFSIKSHLD